MKRCLLAAATVVLALSASPLRAASPEVEAAVKALGEIETDATKLQAYCKVVKEMDAASDDEAKFDALQDDLMELMRSFGPQYEQVMAVSESTSSDSADGQALDAAYSKLDGKCSN